MSPDYTQEIAANLERAETSLRAAKDLAGSAYFDFAASRAYYAAFYAATAALLWEGVEFSKQRRNRCCAPAISQYGQAASTAWQRPQLALRIACYW
jgi:uncharacterized protein (UPF0332 family)